MTIYTKIDNVWVASKRPYVKRSAVQTPAQQVFVKRSGVWTQSYSFDTTPSEIPELSLQIIDNRYIRVGARLPGGRDASLSRIRVLVSRTQPLTSQYGSGFVANEDRDYPNEPWSDWFYNQKATPGNASAVATEVFRYKQYPVNPTADTNLPGDKYYWFAAWSEDENQNWSAGVFSKIFMPKSGTQADSVLVKETNFLPSNSGTAGLNGVSYVEGDLTQSESPRFDGFWFYQNKITQAIGEQGAPTIRSAQIRVSRSNDSGQPTANVNLFWHEANTPSEMPVLDANRQNIHTVGTLNKGETNWFDLPDNFLSHLNTQTKGLGLAYGITASDYMVAKGLSTDPRSGELNVVWEEAL